MLVRVVNDNKFDYTEKYRGKVITIPSKGFITMDVNEASHFMGTNPGTARVDAGGVPMPESYKMLRIEQISIHQPIETAANKKFVCMMDGTEHANQAALDAYILANHTDKMVDEDAREKLAKPVKVEQRRRKVKVVSDASTNRDGSEAKV